MTFTYPAVFTPHKDGKGYHAVFPDLECCEAAHYKACHDVRVSRMRETQPTTGFW